MNVEESLNKLILEHLWVVKAVALRLKSTMLLSADLEELIAVGNLELVCAAHRFEARNGCQFKTYAFMCIRGQMIKSFTRIDGHHDSGLIEWEPLPDLPLPAVQEETLYGKEQVQLMSQMMDTLRDRHRQTLEVFLSGASLVQYARESGWKRDRVMKWQRTGIKQMMAASAGLR